jgi:hypothetical protein
MGNDRNIERNLPKNLLVELRLLLLFAGSKEIGMRTVFTEEVVGTTNGGGGLGIGSGIV